MNKNKTAIGILSIFLLSSSISFASYDIVIPKVSPPTTMQRLCWDSISQAEYPCAPGTPYNTDITGSQPSGAPLIITEKITFGKFKEVMGGAFSQLIKISESILNWIGNFRK
ncbi:MAG: hypothetical protein ACYC3G_01620 [Minisyncoccota bacterium]